jgi:hypothetical protein
MYGIKGRWELNGADKRVNEGRASLESAPANGISGNFR